ncbi:MAG: GNAT family N-acetyltransferase [Chloroflexi bacterium]|nr:GNAT family N-acetyltransferase [Chloroflexota bacterium]MCH7787183.1 GNAT family N-acetyltransferase [Chloroflexota bacterium]
MTTYSMTAYPKTMELLDGQTMTIRPMVSSDRDALLKFFLRVSEEDRYYLKEDVTSPEVIKQWAENLNYARALPLLVLLDGEIVADGTLHRRRAGARKHIGEIRVVVDAEYRSKGVGTALIRELITIAKDADLENLIFELVAEEQAPAVRAAESLGFVRLATLPNHVRDFHGKPDDLLILELSLGKWQEWWGF